jgi:hypothetical protein
MQATSIRYANVLSYCAARVKPLSPTCAQSATPVACVSEAAAFAMCATQPNVQLKATFQPSIAVARVLHLKTAAASPRKLCLFTQPLPATRPNPLLFSVKFCFNLARCVLLPSWGRFYEHAFSPSRNSRQRTTPAPGVLHLLRMPSHLPRKKRRPIVPGTLRLMLRCPAIAPRAGHQYPHKATSGKRTLKKNASADLALS